MAPQLNNFLASQTPTASLELHFFSPLLRVAPSNIGFLLHHLASTRAYTLHARIMTDPVENSTEAAASQLYEHQLLPEDN